MQPFIKDYILSSNLEKQDCHPCPAAIKRINIPVLILSLRAPAKLVNIGSKTPPCLPPFYFFYSSLFLTEFIHANPGHRRWNGSQIKIKCFRASAAPRWQMFHQFQSRTFKQQAMMGRLRRARAAAGAVVPQGHLEGG